ncbi:MAG: BatA and WFA domain-containing protein [Chloroflexi bacterium]|nr:BatA and WFA domain-containing protein [Chloroflexota bacterium]
MTFQQPAALWLLGLIPLVILLHLLRAAANRQLVSSAFLWRELGRDPEVSRRLRPPKLTLLLLLQLLAIVAAAFALSSPRLTAPPGRHLVLVLDASGSMLATDEQPSRFDAALGRARTLLATMSPTDVATVVRAGPRPRTVVSAAESGVALTALGDLRGGGGASAMREALFVASDQARRTPERASEIVVYTDGSFVDPGDLSALGVATRFEMLGRETANRAVTSLSVARQPGGPGTQSAVARLANYADLPTRVGLSLFVDDVVTDRRDVDLSARGQTVAAFDVPAGARRVAVKLAGGDALPADDFAEVSVDIGFVRRVLLVTRRPEALERALKAIPDLKVETVTPERYDGSGAEIVVLDGVVPPTLPSGQLIVVNPPAGQQLLPLKPEIQGVQFSDFDPRHPLLQAVDLASVRLAKATPFVTPPWARVVAEAPAGPLILEGREAGRSVIALGFEPAGSGIDRMIAFPLLVANAVSYLGGGDLSPSLPPGRSVSLPVAPGITEVTLESPSGQQTRLKPEQGSVRLDEIELPGRYTIRETGLGAGEPRIFAVNMADDAESSITPRARQAAPAPPRPGDGTTTTPLEIWPYLVMGALLLLVLEWWRFGRRG